MYRENQRILLYWDDLNFSVAIFLTQYI